MKIIIFFLTALFAAAIQAGEPAIWSVNTRAEVLKGDARGVSIESDGRVTLAPKLTELFKTEQPYIWSSAHDSSGNFYLGTGGDGKIFKVDSSGKGNLFADLAELNVSALAIGKRGELFAGTSPDGKVYHIDAAGKAEIYFEPKEKYIWSLAVLNDGSIAVGTGEGGKIYRVSSPNASPAASLFFDTSELHIISLAVDKNGNLFAGTDSNALVLRFTTDGKPFALLDSPLREIHELAIGPDGSVYALALGESASTAKPSENPAASSVSSVPVNPEQGQKSRYDLTNVKTAVYRILPDGGNDIIWASGTVTGFSLYAQLSGGVLVGTSDKGRIYGIGNNSRETLVLQSDANQISTIKSFGQKIFATSSNTGSLFSFGDEKISEGIYESSVLDAKAAATWGRIWWRSGGAVQMQTRSGNTEKADETWSSWSGAYSDQKGSQISSPKARFFQWRAVLKNSSPAAPSLSEVNVSYLPRNIAPEVLSVTVLPTNVGLAANPPIPVDPNIELSGLTPQMFGIMIAPVQPRRIYQRGARSLQWTAEDRNGDRLVYDVHYKEVGEANYKLLRENLSENFYTIDGQALADGRYIFRITAKDSPSNPGSLALSGEKTSEPIDIDNTPPVVSEIGPALISGDTARIYFEAVDAASFLTRAEYSINGGEWQSVYADDGISDSPRERYTILIPLRAPGEYAVTLRVFDVNANAGNARVLVKKN